jgi:SAM-dependent methyltransferase
MVKCGAVLRAIWTTVAGVTDRQERATSFGSIAEDYDGLRPPAPEQAVDWLVPSHCEVAVDLGAGTGLFTRTLVGRAAEVIAVEPDARMRTVLAGRSPTVRVVEGRGESIPLPDAVADGVFVSSAWHWMNPERAVPEIGRVLRDGGRFGLIWTSRDRDVDWVRDLDLVPGEEAREADSPERFRRRLASVVLPDPQIFHNVARETFTFVRTMTVDDFVAMMATYSRVILASPDDRAQRLAHVRIALQERFPGAEAIDIPMQSWCWRADRITRRTQP